MSRTFSDFLIVSNNRDLHPMGCSDNDSGSVPVPPNVPTNRIYVMTIGSGVLTPAVGSAGEANALDATQDWEYILTLDNVTEDVLWYANRPDRKAGATSIKDYAGSWNGIYGEVSPNAVLDGYLIEPIHDGLYLNLKDPLYDSETNNLVFQVTLLGSSMDNPHPVDPINIYDIRITVFDNTPEGEVNYWSFGQVARESVLEATGTEGLYKLSLIGAYAELIQLQNAPGTRYEVLDQASLEYNWQTYFGADAPNASLTGVSLADPGVLKLALLELDKPSHDGTNVYYDVRVLGGQNLSNDTLSDVTLLIDAPDDQYTLCKQSGNEEKCYGHCFSNSTSLCCPKPDSQQIPGCGTPPKTAWCEFTDCKSCANVCTTHKEPSGELTTLVIQNDTKSSVTVYLQVGATAGASKGACPADWAPIQFDDYPCEKVVGETCQWTLKPGAENANTIKGVKSHCTNGTISFEMDPAETCGMSLGEFTLNVDPATKGLKEGLDISLVNGNNGKIVVDLGKESGWMVQSTSRFVASIENYEGTGANNKDIEGVYNYLCDTCIAKVNPPSCLGEATCSSQPTCNLLRDGDQQGGTVTFAWKGTEW